MLNPPDKEAAEKNLLSRFIPVDSVEYCFTLIKKHRLHMTITKSRATKYGDFRPSKNGVGHRITVNHNLNHYNFLITLLHEIAHAITWDLYKQKVKPHGQEWKQIFAQTLAPVIAQGTFPKAVQEALLNYIQNPAASACADAKLLEALKKFDKHQPLLLKEIPANSLFKVQSGRIFRKGNLRRKHFLCEEVHSRKLYLVNGLAEVSVLEATE